MKPLVYYAGPIKSDPLENTRRAIYDARYIADAAGVDFIIPHVSCFEHIVLPRSYEEWLQLDFNFIRHCDALYRAPGESEGADREVKFADIEGIPVFYTMYNLEKWKKEVYDTRT